MAEYRVPSTTKVEGMITTHAAVLETHGISAGLYASRPAASAAGKYYFSTDTSVWSRDNGATWDEIESGLGEAAVQALIATDSNLSVAAQAVVTAGACDVDANLSAAAQAAITASHSAPTYDGVNDEVVFQI